MPSLLACDPPLPPVWFNAHDTDPKVDDLLTTFSTQLLEAMDCTFP